MIYRQMKVGDKIIVERIGKNRYEESKKACAKNYEGDKISVDEILAEAISSLKNSRK